MNGHDIEVSVRKREAPDVCHEELRLEGVAASPLAGAPDRPRGEVSPRDPGPEVNQMLGHHARATAHLQDCLAGQVHSQKIQARPKLLSDQVLVEPTAGMRTADLELPVTRLVVVLLLVHTGHRLRRKPAHPSRPRPDHPLGGCHKGSKMYHSVEVSQPGSEHERASTGRRVAGGGAGRPRWRVHTGDRRRLWAAHSLRTTESRWHGFWLSEPQASTRSLLRAPSPPPASRRAPAS